jgi:hypothetical protein
MWENIPADTPVIYGPKFLLFGSDAWRPSPHDIA